MVSKQVNVHGKIGFLYPIFVSGKLDGFALELDGGRYRYSEKDVIFHKLLTEDEVRELKEDKI